MKQKLFYGWVVVVVCTIISTIIFGTRYSFGVFFKSLESDFNLTRTLTSGIFSIYMVLCSVFAILGGWASDRYGPKVVTGLFGFFIALSLLLTSQTTSTWQLFITYSLLLAIGTGPGYTVLMTTATRWFNKKRGLAFGIASSGAGLGTTVMAPLAAYLISNFDWRVAFIVLGLISGAVTISLALLLKRDPAVMGLLPDGVKSDAAVAGVPIAEDNTQAAGFTLLQASKTPSFWFLGMVWLLFAACLSLVLTHLVPHATDMGIATTDAAVALGVLGAASLPGRIFGGAVSDRLGRKTMSIACCLLQAVAMVWLIWVKDLQTLYLFVVVYGLGYGGLDAPTGALIGDIFGLRNLGTIMGALVVGWALGSAIGPALGGFIFDVSRSYYAAFLLGALAMVLCALFVALTRREERSNG